MDKKNNIISLAGALFITFILTVCFALGMFFLLPTVFRLDLTSNWAGLIFFLACIAFAGAVLSFLGKHCLYPKEVAKLEIIGGIRHGAIIETVFSGKSATWPFAKLLIDEDKLWVHTPWGTITHYKLQFPRLTINTSPLFPSLSIDRENLSAVLTFPFFPWYYGRLVPTLKVLGYRFSEE